MARQKDGKRAPITIEFSVHRAAKIRAAELGMKLQAAADEAFAAWLKSSAKSKAR